MEIFAFLSWTPLFLALGAASGFIAGLLGVGGGIVLVPGLFYILTAAGFPQEQMMHVAIGTSLGIIIMTGISSSRAHWKRGAVRKDILPGIIPGLIAGVAAGTFAASIVDGSSLKGVFAVALLFLSGVMLVDSSRFHLAQQLPRQPWHGLMGGFIGFLSTLMGIGGGTISVPYMTLCRVPIHQAVGTASFLGLIISVPAAIGFIAIGWNQDHLPPFSLGYINLPAWVMIVPVSMLAAPWGARVAHSVSVKRLRLVFAIFMMLVALKMLYGVMHG